MFRRLFLALLGAVLAAGFLVSVPSAATAATAGPSSFKVVPKSGVRNDSLRLQWTWKAKVDSYQLQVSTSATFASGVTTVTVKGKKNRPSKSLMAATVSPLRNATAYHARVRSKSGSTYSAWTSVVRTATKVRTPDKITSVAYTPGPGVGEITIRWKTTGKYTTGYAVETGLTSFSPKSGSSMPRHGRSSQVFTAGGSARSLTLTADQVIAAGAPVGSANFLYFRVQAVNKGTAGTASRWYPYLRTAKPKVAPAVTSGTALRVGTFNVLSAPHTDKPWLKRASSVAATIMDEAPTVLAVQELSPGRADGKSGSTKGQVRQTVSLEQNLAAQGGSRYKLVRTTSYVKPGTSHGTQGSRILYDTSKLRLVSDCPDVTGTKTYSTGCAISLPSDTVGSRRSAAVAIFADLATGKEFVMVSAHLDSRHSSKSATEKKYDKLRADQIQAILDHVDSINAEGRPVVFGGDINSWQMKYNSNAPHTMLVAGGFYDTAAAVTTVNQQYSTINHYQTTMAAAGAGVGSRLDVVMVRGITTATRWENVMQVKQKTRPSDHNMVVSDVVLPD